MKKLLLPLLLASFIIGANGQEITRELKPFQKIIVSPRIHLVLKKGNKEHIRLVYSHVSPENINIDVSGKTLNIFLDNARITEKTELAGWNQRRGIYEGATLTAYVTYKDLEYLEIRGNQELTCLSPLSAETFTLKAYGENEITLASVNAEYFRTSLYGENRLTIKAGKAKYQKYRLFGENKIDTRALKSYSTVANIYGESKLKVNTDDELKVNAFGESQVMYTGKAHLSKRIVIGETQFTRVE